MFLVQYGARCSHLDVQGAYPGDSITAMRGIVGETLKFGFASFCMVGESDIIVYGHSPSIHLHSFVGDEMQRMEGI